MTLDNFEIKEELKWVYRLYKGQILWGEYLSKEEAEQACANIKFNMTVKVSNEKKI